MDNSVIPPTHVWIDLETGDWFPRPCGMHPERLVQYTIWPTEAEAEAILNQEETSGREVVNRFIQRLLEKNRQLRAKLRKEGER